MLDGVTGPGRIGSELERELGGAAVEPFGTNWWHPWSFTPINLLRALTRPSRASRDGSHSADQIGLTRVHRSHDGRSLSEAKLKTTSRRRS
jgi:hypothetical protein